jgi:hypothetical protein
MHTSGDGGLMSAIPASFAQEENRSVRDDYPSANPALADPVHSAIYSIGRILRAVAGIKKGKGAFPVPLPYIPRSRRYDFNVILIHQRYADSIAHTLHTRL